ncbi:MAG: sigma-E factor negative regulatory protein [Pseudomonadota bacterium]
MDTNRKNRERISALGDGELATGEVELALAALQGADGRHAWALHHRIGDVLRAQAGPELSAAFEARLAERLAGEAPHARRASAEPALPPEGITAPL